MRAHYLRQFMGEPRFRDRREAGVALAGHLEMYRSWDALVLGIPRGGVPVAEEVARQLGADLDVVVARKLGAPHQPELAIGAVTANGGRFLDDEGIAELGIADAYVDQITAEQMAEAQARQQRFRGGRPAPRIAGRIVIVVDDGLATGATMRAAVRSVRQQRASRLVVAVPVGSEHACTALRQEADEVVCPNELEAFWAVGLHYEHFEPVDDSEVQRILREYAPRQREPVAPGGAGRAAGRE